MLTALFLVLLVLWLLGFLRPGNLDFMRAPAFSYGGYTATILDVLVGIAIVWVILALRGPLAVAGAVLLALWVLSILGFVVIEGLPLPVLIVLVLMVGVMIHLLTRRTA